MSSSNHPQPFATPLVASATQPANPLDMARARPERDEEPKAIAERLLKARTIHISGEVEDRMATRIINQLLVLDADEADRDKPITIVLNSPGGSVTSGMAIYDTIRFVRPRVKIVCTGLCASIATIILVAAQKGFRLTLPSTRLLIHQPLIPMTVYGPASDLEITANEILKTRDRINLILAKATGQPLDRVAKDAQRDYWLAAEEAVAYGLCDRIVTSKSELDAL